MRYIIFFIITLFLYTSCSQKSGDDYLKSAEENLKNNKITEAVSDYESFVTENPENDNAPEALASLALIYQNKMDKKLSEKESLQKSADLYKQVFEKYPNSPKAPTSLFMSAFILANDLKKYHAAEITYNIFLQKFPNHELAASAREELKNLGLSPEEILKKSNTPNS